MTTPDSENNNVGDDVRSLTSTTTPIPRLGNLEPRTTNPERFSDLFLPYQQRWIDDNSTLKIVEKSRQIGFSYADAYDSVQKAADRIYGNHVWVNSRDETTSRLYLSYCKRWARVLNYVAEDLGEQMIDSKKDLTAMVLRFSSGFCIHALSSVPDTFVGKPGYVKLDEFAINPHQRELYDTASPCITWGGKLSIISTHRGIDTVFNHIIREIKEQGNPVGWSHHRVSIHDAVNEGLVERINFATHRKESRGAFLARMRTQCLDEESWQQEFCCQPADENSAFLPWSLIHPCETVGCLKPFDYLENCQNYLYVGVDVARKKHLCVIDVAEKIGDVMWDRMRIELQDKTFSEIREELYRILALPKIHRCCIDATGLGMQLAEEAKERFGGKVEPITFNAELKEKLAFGLRHCFEDRALRIDPNPALRSDLRGIRKETTANGNLRFIGEPDAGPHASGHCDRFWAKALRQHAATQRREFWAIVID